MAQVDYYIRLDLKKEHEQGVQHIKYGDANTRVLRFFVHSGGKTYDISDKHVVLHFLKSDGTSGSVRCFHAAEKGTCYCIVSSQMSAVAGEVKCDLKIYSGDTLLHSPKFYLLVGTDALSVGSASDQVKPHKAFLQHEITVLEGLDLSEVEPGDYFLVAPPLKLGGLEAAPVRAFLITDYIFWSK